MARLGAGLRRLVFGISPEETSPARRGFQRGEEQVARRLEKIVRVFVDGYREALEHDETVSLVRRLNTVEPEFRGFAFEGAAMGLALLDHLTPWKSGRIRHLLAGPGAGHRYMIHVGIGWAVARLPWLRWRAADCTAKFDPLLRWLVVDGYGFHEGFFHWRRCLSGEAYPRGISRYGRRAFDQGLGRSLWFVSGADVTRMAHTVGAFPEDRRGDLWSGIGLACAYAGGVSRAAVENLRHAAGVDRPHLAQGAAFAAKARQHAGNAAEHTEMACHVLCGVSADEAGKVTDDALADLADCDGVPAYEIWRQRIRSRFA